MDKKFYVMVLPPIVAMSVLFGAITIYSLGSGFYPTIFAVSVEIAVYGILFYLFFGHTLS